MNSTNSSVFESLETIGLRNAGHIFHNLSCAILEGKLKEVETHQNPPFQVAVPVSCPGVPNEILEPKSLWKYPKAYDRKGEEFKRNFEQSDFDVPGEVRAAGPAV